MCIRDRFRNNAPNSISPDVSATFENGVHNVSIYEAWNNEKFSPNDYFPGTALRAVSYTHLDVYKRQH